jgi:hypothetical protein
MRGVPRERRAISAAPCGTQANVQDAGRAAHDPGQFLGRIELQALDDAEAVAQWAGQQAGAGGGADQRERRQVELDRARRRALADHDVDLEIFHRRVQHFLDDRRQPVDLVDEQHVVRLQVGQQRGQVAGALDHRAGGLAQVDAHLGGDDMGQRGLAQAGRAEDQHVVERLLALARGLDVDLQLFADGFLAQVFVQALGTDAGLDRFVFAGDRACQDAGFFHARLWLR